MAEHPQWPPEGMVELTWTEPWLSMLRDVGAPLAEAHGRRALPEWFATMVRVGTREVTEGAALCRAVREAVGFDGLGGLYALAGWPAVAMVVATATAALPEVSARYRGV